MENKTKYQLQFLLFLLIMYLQKIFEEFFGLLDLTKTSAFYISKL